MENQNSSEQIMPQQGDPPDIRMPEIRDTMPPATEATINPMEFYEQYEVLSSASSIGLIVTDADGVIVSVNKAVQNMLGISAEECTNMNVADFYYDQNDRQHLLDMLSASKTVHDFEVKLKHADGSLRTVLANVDSIAYNNSNMLLTSLYDITQYKQILETMNESESSYRTLFSNAPVGIIVTDKQGDIILCNKAAQELSGYSVEELKDVHMQDFYNTVAERQRLLDLTKSLGYVRDFEATFRQKNGGVISVLVNTDQIDFKNLKNVMLTSIRDISNLKRIEDELTKERDFSNAILNITASLIVVLDNHGKVIRFNRACEQVTGYMFHEIEGMSFADAPFMKPMISREKAEILLSGNFPSSHDTVLVSKSGTQHHISWTNTTLFNKEGRVEYVIATGIDITEQQRAEEKLQKANEKLASWVKELQERTDEMDRLNDMGEQLQSCQTLEEACAISTQYIKQICPASHGALYLINASKNYTEAVEMWGEPVYTQKTFTPLSCWAVRRGRQHLLDGSHYGLQCEHITGPQSGQYLCVPLLVNGEVTGILHLNHVAAAGQDREEVPDASFTEHKTQLIKTVAEHIALALANLRLKETLRQQSIRDALTGLFNRRYMEETLERELMRAQRENESLGVIMFDIDHFKEFNDLAGHDGGDALLRELGIFLNKSTRGGDVVCRYGGEEFLAVLPGISIENARLRAEELRTGASELLVYHLGKPLGKCTISLGVATYPENGLTSEDLLKAADNALYRAKSEGRNKVILA